ncbi:hypothetical protein Dda_3098 [Drechslerella dactyloides]|uniref:Uncharacterized protein n=1 Tax=Drechslerella dactyloides TaxID=74499 RepID=A0AAD6J547_DREDA|nr:hypothetical protein Dda_3098 [Drechslerella dactyloides]
MSTGGSSLAALATSKSDIDQEIIDNLQDFTADTLTFRNEATGIVQKCEVLDTLGYHDKRAVYKCLWRGKFLVLKWWDETDRSCRWSPYIPSIYARGQVIQGALKAGLIIIMEFRSGEIFTPRIWHFMEEAERLLFKRTLHDAFHSFREEHVVHPDAQFNVLWDLASRRLTVIDWEEMRIDSDNETVRPENFEIFLVLTSCEERNLSQ